MLKLRSSYLKWQQVKKDILEVQNSREEILKEIAYLKQFIEDIEILDVVNNNLTDLQIKKDNLKKQQELSNVYEDIRAEFSTGGNALSRVLEKQKLVINNMAKDEDRFSKILDLLENILENFDKIINQLDDTNYEYENIEFIEEKISEFKKISRKYNIPADLLEDRFVEAINSLKSHEAKIDNSSELEVLEIKYKSEYLELCDIINRKRDISARKLEKSVMTSLKDLYMNNTEFKVEKTILSEDKWRDIGNVAMNFMFRTNPVSDFGELGKIASGGELSRFMLSLKLALSTDNKTLIFDEIDTGISGKVSEAVGVKLSNLAKNNQVFSITHHAQVAALAQNHLHVVKSISKDDVKISALYLSKEHKLSEIARMISGKNITEDALNQARNLIKP